MVIEHDEVSEVPDSDGHGGHELHVSYPSNVDYYLGFGDRMVPIRDAISFTSESFTGSPTTFLTVLSNFIKIGSKPFI